MENFSNLNWLAVVTGTIVSFLIGWAWYSEKLVGKKWAAGSGVNMDSASKMPVFAMASQVAALFLLALVVGLTATVNALFTAILAILAVATFTASMGGFVKKSNFAIAVDFFYVIIAGIILILCQGIF